MTRESDGHSELPFADSLPEALLALQGLFASASAVRLSMEPGKGSHAIVAAIPTSVTLPSELGVQLRDAVARLLDKAADYYGRPYACHSAGEVERIAAWKILATPNNAHLLIVDTSGLRACFVGSRKFDDMPSPLFLKLLRLIAGTSAARYDDEMIQQVTGCRSLQTRWRFRQEMRDHFGSRGLDLTGLRNGGGWLKVDQEFKRRIAYVEDAPHTHGYRDATCLARSTSSTPSDS